MKIYIVLPLDRGTVSSWSGEAQLRLDRCKSALKQHFKDDYIMFYDYTDLTNPDNIPFDISRSILSGFSKIDPDYIVILRGWEDCPRAGFERYVFSDMYPGRIIDSETMDEWMKEFDDGGILTVGDLIKTLEKYPKDSLIYVDNFISTYCGIKTIEHINDESENVGVAIRIEPKGIIG